ncbi:MAG: glycosyltransferase family 4 protein [bacterium]
MNKKKLAILFIAKNIPTPTKESNRIVFDIAHHLSDFCNIEFLFPKEIVPFWLRNKSKFKYLKELSKSWKFEGFRVHPIPYIKLPFKKMQFWTLFRLSRKAKEIVQNSMIDLVHAHYLFPDGYIAYRIFRKYDIPYVLTFRNQDRQYLEIISKKNPDYKKAAQILMHAKSVLVTNLGYKNFIENRFDINCEIVPHGIEKEVFDVPIPGKTDNKIIVTTIADTLETKNVDWVIRAFKDYSGTEDIELYVIGDAINRKELFELANNDNRLKFYGRIPREQVLNLLRESDIFALPSSRETFGLVYLEAAATKNALIGYKGEGVWGVFEDHHEMLFCNNFEEFKEKLFFTLNSAGDRMKLQNNAFLKAKEMEWESIKKMYLDVYKKAMEKDNSSSS